MHRLGGPLAIVAPIAALLLGGAALTRVLVRRAERRYPRPAGMAAIDGVTLRYTRAGPCRPVVLIYGAARVDLRLRAPRRRDSRLIVVADGGHALHVTHPATVVSAIDAAWTMAERAVAAEVREVESDEPAPTSEVSA